MTGDGMDGLPGGPAPSRPPDGSGDDRWIRVCTQCRTVFPLVIPRSSHECESRRVVSPEREEPPSATLPAHLPSDPHRLYRLIRTRLRTRVVGHDSAVRSLALCGVHHLLGDRGNRVLLIAESGVGKTTLARALAESLEICHIETTVSELSQISWSGRSLADVLSDLEDRAGSREMMSRSLIFLDEICKLSTLHTAPSTSAFSYNRGRAENVMTLLGGGEVPLGGHDQWRADRALIVCAGVFNGLPPGQPTPGDLVGLGFQPELVGRFGKILRLESLDQSQMRDVLRMRLTESGEAAEIWGFSLRVSPAAISTVAKRITEDPEVDPRSGAQWLLDAADRMLITAVEEGRPAGSIIEVGVHDLDLPPTSAAGESAVGFRHG